MKALYILLGIIGLGVVAYFPVLDAAIPPTRAFFEVIVDGVSLEADSYNSVLNITEGDNITITPTAANNTIRFDGVAAVGDNLGNHIPTQTLNMTEELILIPRFTDAGRPVCTTSIHGALIYNLDFDSMNICSDGSWSAI